MVMYGFNHIRHRYYGIKLQIYYICCSINNSFMNSVYFLLEYYD